MRKQFWLENLNRKDRSEDVCVNGRMILKWVLKQNVDGIHVSEDRDRWRALGNTVMDLPVP